MPSGGLDCCAYTMTSTISSDGSLFMRNGFDSSAQAAFDLDADRAAQGHDEDDREDENVKHDSEDEEDGEEGNNFRQRRNSRRRTVNKIRKSSKSDAINANQETLDAAIKAGQRAAVVTGDWFKEKITEENYEAFARCWKRTEKAINEVIESTMEESFQGIHKFLEHAAEAEFMHLAALSTGVNVGDHEITCAKLCAMIRESLSPHLALIGPDVCGSVQTGVEAIVRELVSAIDDTHDEEAQDEDSDEEELSTVSRTGAGKRVRSSTLLQRMEKNVTAKRRRKNAVGVRKQPKTLLELEAMLEAESMKQRTIFVVFDDAENIDVAVLRGIMRILLSYHNDPERRVFRFGVVLGLRSSSYQGVHGLLTRAETARLQIQRFKIEQGRALLDKITDDILMSDRMPLRLGPRVLDRLSQVFLQEEYSFHSFMRSLKLLTMVHFSKVRCAYLCCRREGEGVPLLMEEDLNYLLSLPSVVKEIAPKLDSMSESAKLTMVGNLISYQESSRKHRPEAFMRLFETNRILQPHLHSGFRRSLRAAYVELLSDPKGTCKDLRARLDKCSLDTLQQLLVAWKNPKDVQKFQELRSADQDTSTSVPSPSVRTLQGDALRNASMKKNKRMELLQAGMNSEDRIVQSKAARKFVLKRWEELVEKIVCSTQRPLDEIFALHSAKALNKLMMPSHRDGILSALTNISVNTKRKSHDTCTVYQILRGHGRRKQLSMLEWYEEFCAANEADDDIEQRARFMQASTELRFLGICKPSTTSTNNIIKLIFD